MKAFDEKITHAAEMYLKRRDFEILDTNWRSPDGEGGFDIISLLMIAESRALIRHHINCLLKDCKLALDKPSAASKVLTCARQLLLWQLRLLKRLLP